MHKIAEVRRSLGPPECLSPLPPPSVSAPRPDFQRKQSAWAENGTPDRNPRQSPSARRKPNPPPKIDCECLIHTPRHQLNPATLDSVFIAREETFWLLLLFQVVCLFPFPPFQFLFCKKLKPLVPYPWAFSIQTRNTVPSCFVCVARWCACLKWIQEGLWWSSRFLSPNTQGIPNAFPLKLVPLIQNTSWCIGPVKGIHTRHELEFVKNWNSSWIERTNCHWNGQSIHCIRDIYPSGVKAHLCLLRCFGVHALLFVRRKWEDPWKWMISFSKACWNLPSCRKSYCTGTCLIRIWIIQVPLSCANLPA